MREPRGTDRRRRGDDVSWGVPGVVTNTLVTLDFLRCGVEDLGVPGVDLAAAARPPLGDRAAAGGETDAAATGQRRRRRCRRPGVVSLLSPLSSTDRLRRGERDLGEPDAEGAWEPGRRRRFGVPTDVARRERPDADLLLAVLRVLFVDPTDERVVALRCFGRWLSGSTLPSEAARLSRRLGLGLGLIFLVVALVLLRVPPRGLVGRAAAAFRLGFICRRRATYCAVLADTGRTIDSAIVLPSAAFSRGESWMSQIL